MSPALYTEESDEDDALAGAPSLPAGSKNYMTRAGYQRLQHELKALMDDERPRVVEAVHWAAKNGDRSENGDYLYGKKRLREIDRRIRFLSKRLEIAQVVETWRHHGSDQVFFGATVTYADRLGEQKSITILGTDEAQSCRDEVSWIAPIARALLKRRQGDEVTLKSPTCVQTLEILHVSYPAKPD